MDREELAAVLRRSGVYDEEAFDRLSLFDKPPWIYPRSRLEFELGIFGTAGVEFYEGPVRIGLSIERGFVCEAFVKNGDEALRVSDAAGLERAIRRVSQRAFETSGYVR